MADRWEDDRWEETPEEQIERRYATVDKLGEWSGQDKPTLMDTAKRLNAVKSEYGLSGEDSDQGTAQASKQFITERFKALGFDYEDVHALALVAALQWADTLIAFLQETEFIGRDDLRAKLLTEFGDTWIDGVLVGATHRKAVE